VCIGSLDDRNSLGYLVLKDKICGIKLVHINDLVNNKSKKIIGVICLEMLLIFSNGEPALAKGFTAPISRIRQTNGGYFNNRLIIEATGQSPSGNGSGGNENPSFGDNAASCSSNQTPKSTSEVTNYGLGSQPKPKIKRL